MCLTTTATATWPIWSLILWARIGFVYVFLIAHKSGHSKKKCSPTGAQWRRWKLAINTITCQVWSHPFNKWVDEAPDCDIAAWWHLRLSHHTLLSELLEPASYLGFHRTKMRSVRSAFIEGSETWPGISCSTSARRPGWANSNSPRPYLTPQVGGQ